MMNIKKEKEYNDDNAQTTIRILPSGLTTEEERLVRLFANQTNAFIVGKTPTKDLESIFAAMFLSLDDRYLQLIEQFDNALDTDNYTMAYAAFSEIIKILPVGVKHHEKLLRIQMAGLTKND